MANHSFIEPRVIARLKSLPFHSRMPMLGSVTGMHRSPHRGSSLEFAEYRKYVPGDDTRRLDWRAYGRSDRYYIKEFEADTNLRLCLVVDTSGSMNYANGGQSKLEFCQTPMRLAGLSGGESGRCSGTVLRGGKFRSTDISQTQQLTLKSDFG